MKKVYTIEITGAANTGVWYHNKIGRQFEAELTFKFYNSHKTDGYVLFKVSPAHFVKQVDCKIISEKLIEPYQK